MNDKINLYNKALNDLVEVTVNGVKYVIFNGSIAVGDYKIALDYALLKGLSEVKIRDYEGVKTITTADLAELIQQMLIFGYETWLEFFGGDE